VPERKEFVETKQYAVILLPVEPSQDAKRTIIDVTQSGIPLLINSTPMDKTNGDT
jgi:hypothetical protein